MDGGGRPLPTHRLLPQELHAGDPAAPGYAKIAVRPQMGHLTSASGDVITPKGMVHVEWTRTPQGECELHYTLPDGMEDLSAE